MTLDDDIDIIKGRNRDKLSIDPDLAVLLTEITASGSTGRGPSSLCGCEVWGGAIRLLQDCERIAVVSGFYVPSAFSPETDGPSGSIFLARALERAGLSVKIWTDVFCLDCFKKCAYAVGFQPDNVEDASVPGFEGWDADLLIYVERLGRAKDGGYYNMKGENISRWTPPLDSYAIDSGLPVIGIGDGGNEVGMGSLTDGLRSIMPDYARCLSVVKADVCIPVDVSNWGAYALAAAISSVGGRWVGQSEEEERMMLLEMSDCGAVDGITKTRGASVDGLRLERHLEVVSLLRAAAGF
jgi:hypothetical protein